MRLTKKEKEIILKNREKEEAKKSKMVGYSKEDLYRPVYRQYTFENWFVSASEKEASIKDFISKFELAVPAGTRFDGFIEEDGSVSWYDSYSGSFEQMDAEWAQKYLRDIRPIVRKKKF